MLGEETHKNENERIINFPKHFPNELFALLIEGKKFKLVFVESFLDF